MENLKALSKEDLVSQTKILVQREREITIEILHFLKEIERRHLFLEMGFSSLFDFCTRYLGYSEQASQRRISSMRLLREVPELEEKVKTGELKLNTLSTAQSFFRSQVKEQGKNYTKEEKKEVLDSLCGKSTREAEKVLATISPQYVPIAYQDKERPISQDKTQIQFLADDELISLLERVRELMACPQDANPSYCAMFKKLARLYLEKKDPLQKECKSTPKTENLNKPTEPSTKETQPKEKQCQIALPTPASRYIATETKRALYRRANGQCEFRAAKINSRCESRHGLQIEHLIPHAVGGSNKIENLQLLCSGHNALRAITFFGEKKIASHKIKNSKITTAVFERKIPL